MTDTLEKAIDWMDRALRETRETLAEVDPDKREEVTRAAAAYLAARVVCLPNGATLEFWPNGGTLQNGERGGITWHGVFARHNYGLEGPTRLSVFQYWLALARVKAGAQ